MGFSKRLICLALCLVFLLSSISCGESDTESTVPETSTPIKEIEPAVDNYFTVHEDLAALPIASGDMSVDEFRSLCVEFARLQGSFLWRPSREIRYSNWNAGEIRLVEGRLYGGLPYSAAGSTIYAFLDFYDRESGVMTPPISGDFNKQLGNNCSMGAFWAWGRVSDTLSFTATRYMNASTGCIRLGRYAISSDITDFADYTTHKICKNNKIDVMCEAYALLLPADGLVHFDGERGHAMMASNASVVVRDESGKIDSDASYVYIIEQHDDVSARRLEDGTLVYNVGGIDNKFTFTELYDKGYLPFTIAEFVGTSGVEEAELSIGTDKTTLTYADIKKLSLTSNYPMAKVSVTLTDSAGEEVYHVYRYPTQSYYRGIPLSDVCSSLSTFWKGSYDMTVTAIISTGETVEVWSGEFVRS